MKNLVQTRIIRSLLICSLAIISCCVLAISPTPEAAINASNNPSIIIPKAPNINAHGYVLMDANSGAILASKNMNEKVAPASLTKLMTLYVASQAIAQNQIQLNDPVRISKKAWQRGGSRMFLKVGSQVPVKDLIDGIIVASGNDACVALAQYIAGNETSFADLMNQTATRLGMHTSHFTDSTGLPHKNHYSTPYDLATLARHIINDFPQDYGWYKQKWITFNGIRQPNRNRLLWRDTSVDGLKTGHTKAAGYCLISSADRNNTRLISVVMGAPTDSSRANDSQALLNWGFRFYETHKLFAKNQNLASPRIWLGDKKYIGMGISHNLFITIPKGNYQNLKATLHLQPNLKAPIKKGNTYGEINVQLNGKTLTTVPLISLQNDPIGGLWTRFTDHIVLLFKG